MASAPPRPCIYVSMTASRSHPTQTLRGLGVEEVDVSGLDREHELAGVGRKLAGGGLNDELGAGDLAMEELGGTELLDEVYVHGQRARAGAARLHVLGPQAHLDGGEIGRAHV